MKRIPFLSLILLGGDILLFYGALALTLFLRNASTQFATQWNLHITPFSILLILWITIFYIGGLYERKFLKATASLQDKIVRNMVAAGIIGAFLFYLVPYFGITPKTNLLIHIGFMTIALGIWRAIIARTIASVFKVRVLFFGVSPDILDMIERLSNNPQLGYAPIVLMTANQNITLPPSVEMLGFESNLQETVKTRDINMVIASADVKQYSSVIGMLNQILPLEISFMDLPTFYERLTGKIPTSLISEVWFLENLAQSKSTINATLKRIFDIIIAIASGCALIILFPFIALAIKLSSPGPVLIRQIRVGKNKKEFIFVKFRSMHALSPDGLAEKEGALWAKEQDPRITRIGRILRKTHIDELPQVWNIFKNDISVVGPRPERPEIVKHLETMISHYDMRHLIKPGVTGWAQINMPQVYAG
ncbi:MAG: exopolysaccharide biosynthesis polyprenyl glycosylphosphotransferase, partial [Candidatus Niyogibacteria bacterium]|nr:exopolysaccharide biosynthesis polyprenyl glycosylphosphotransferase [Candidatus Niyogibacteria bacterium]